MTKNNSGDNSLLTHKDNNNNIKNMKAKDLMTNNLNDKFRVFVGAKSNFVNQWTCSTLRQAEKSIMLFKRENLNKERNFARIYFRKGNKVLKIKDILL